MIHDYTSKCGDISIIPMNEYYSEKYRLLRNLPDNKSIFFSNQIITLEDQKSWFEKYKNDPKQIMFAIMEKDSFIGGCGLYDIDYKKRSAEFGRILLDKDKRNKGIGSIVLQLILATAKNELNFTRIYLQVSRNNLPAIKAYEKVGFHQIEFCSDRQSIMMVDLR